MYLNLWSARTRRVRLFVRIYKGFLIEVMSDE